MIRLPELGVGLVYLPGLEPLLDAADQLIDVIEVEPQAFWVKRDGRYLPISRSLAALARRPQHKLVHGVGSPVGGSTGPDPAQLEPFAHLITELRAPWASEHLSFNHVGSRTDGYDTLFLLPPAQTDAAVELAVRNIRLMRASLPVPFAFETGVNYLQPRAGELTDGAFFAAVANGADCGILLDLHNLWCNERNGRQPVAEVLAELPLHRVWEVHLAGGQELDRYWLDAHCGPVPGPVLDLAADVLPALPNVKAVLFELIPDYLAAGRVEIPELLDQITVIQELWATRTRRPSSPTRGPAHRPAATAVTPDPSRWEQVLGALTVGGEPGEDPLAAELRQDPGTGIIRQVVSRIRSGMVVDTLKLTFRLLALSLGEAQFHELLAAFWRQSPPSMLAAEEAAAFGGFVRRTELGVPHLEDVLDYELAMHRAVIHGRTERVEFNCEPLALLTALGRGQLPANLQPGDYQLVIAPE